MTHILVVTNEPGNSEISVNDTRVTISHPGISGDNLRGYSADVVVVDASLSERTMEEIIEPMVRVNDGEVVELR